MLNALLGGIVCFETFKMETPAIVMAGNAAVAREIKSEEVQDDGKTSR